MIKSYHLCLTLGTFIPTFGKQTANGHLREGRFPWRKWDFSSEVTKKIVNVEIKYKSSMYSFIKTLLDSFINTHILVMAPNMTVNNNMKNQ